MICNEMGFCDGESCYRWWFDKCIVLDKNVNLFC